MTRVPDPAIPPRTPLQRASWYLREAFDAAREDGRAYEAFVELLTVRAASENAARLDREARPS